MKNDQLTGAVGDFVRMAALGATEVADLQRLACDLLGIPQPAKPTPADVEAQALLSAARSTQDLYWAALRNLEAFLEIEIDGTRHRTGSDLATIRSQAANKAWATRRANMGTRPS